MPLPQGEPSAIRLATPEKTHFAAITEPKEIAGLLRALHSYNGTPAVNAALKLAPLVFVRPGELRKARWADMDLEAGEWRYFVTKTKQQHIVPLASQAVDILRELQPLTGLRGVMSGCFAQYAAHQFIAIGQSFGLIDEPHTANLSTG